MGGNNKGKDHIGIIGEKNICMSQKIVVSNDTGMDGMDRSEESYIQVLRYTVWF